VSAGISLGFSTCPYTTEVMNDEAEALTNTDDRQAKLFGFHWISLVLTGRRTALSGALFV
jgi:hypothetical protein